MNFRAARGTVAVDIGMLDSGTGYLQNRNFANLATNYNFVLEPNGGNVGIGTASPAQTVHIHPASGSNHGGIQLDDRGDGCCAQFSMVAGSNNARWDTYVSAGGAYYLYQVTNASGGTGLGQWLTILNGGNVGIGATSPSQKLEVDSGNIYISGGQYLVSSGNYNTGGLNSYANGTLCFSTSGQTVASYFTFGACSSDRRLKKDISYLTEGLDVVEKLKPANFRLRKDPTNKLKAGFIAQDVALAIPEAVSLNSDHLYGFDSTAVLSYTVKAVQQLKSLFDGDHDALTKLQADNDNLRAANDNEAAQIKNLTARLDALEAARH